MIKKLLLYPLALAFVAACGDEARTPLTFSSTNAGAVSNAVGSTLLETTAQTMGDPTSVVSATAYTHSLRSGLLKNTLKQHLADSEFQQLRYVNFQGAEDCIDPSSDLTGDEATDSDEDGIPASLIISLTDCAEAQTEESILGSFTFTGTISVTDSDDNDATSGFSVAMENFEFTWELPESEGSSGGTIASSYDLEFTATVSDSSISISYALDYSVSVDGVDSNSGQAVSQNIDMSFESTIDYDGNDADDPWDAGTLNMSGSFTLAVADQSGTLEYEGTDLAYTQTGCGTDEPGFTDGTITLTAGSDTITITATDCSYSGTFEGEEVWTSTAL